ncbi:MAG TPA: hypothetical protein GX691_00155 [Clostridia bacterium]|jgi:hypothetical protein|nr:hypothetical protein [Clostridia bacterium]
MPEGKHTAKQSIFFVIKLIILLTGTVVGAAISDPIDIFYNLLIMPGVGSLGFISFRKKWYFVPPAVLVITFLWQAVAESMQIGFGSSALYAGLCSGVIHGFLTLLGVLVAALLQLAFRKKRDRDQNPKLSLKVFSGAAAAVLIFFLLSVTNSFAGNPVSAYFADKAIQQYVEETYPSLDLEIGKPRYNFKFNRYVAQAQSRTSTDTRFYIHYFNGGVNFDSYESDVLSKYNTLDRLSGEYSALAQKLVSEELGYENNTTRVMYDKSEYEMAADENAVGILELDMEFDKSLPMKAEVSLRLYLPDISMESIASVLTESHRVFTENGCHFSRYDLTAERDGVLVMVNKVSPAQIEGGNLVSLLEKARTDESADGISVFIKGHRE